MTGLMTLPVLDALSAAGRRRFFRLLPCCVDEPLLGGRQLVPGEQTAAIAWVTQRRDDVDLLILHCSKARVCQSQQEQS